MSLSLTAFLGLFAAAAPVDVPPLAAELPTGVAIHLERDIDAPAATVWGLLAHDYVAIDAWEHRVQASRAMTEADLPAGVVAHADAPVVGRIVNTGLGEIAETLIEYDEDGRSFTFHAAGLPPILRYAQNTQSVVDLGDGRSRVTFDIYLVPKRGLPKKMLAKKFSQGLSRTLDDVAAAVEVQ
jgi:hypothetical protein